MKDNFDDLSDDFLNEGKDKNKSDKPKKSGPFIKRTRRISLEGEEGKPIDLSQLPTDLPPEIRNIIQSISDIKERGGNIEEELNLGEPDEHESHDEDGNTLDKSTWNTDFGSVTRISIGGELPNGLDGESIRDLFRSKFGIGPKKKKEVTLEEKLEIALEDENYLEAARLRDEIAEKNKKSENSGNVDTDKDSEGSIWDLI